MQDSNSQLTTRKLWIDNLRGLSMVAILLFHTEMYYAGYDITPYSFYVENALAMFFFLSGYLFYKDNGTIHPKQKIFSIAVNLIIPYFIFTTLIALPKALAHGEEINILTLASEILLGEASWFIAALIVAEIIFSLLLWITRGRHIILTPIIIILTALAFAIGNLENANYNTYNFWHINEALLALLFLYLGYAYHQFEKSLTPRIAYLVPLAACLIILKYIEYRYEWKMVMGPIVVTSIPTFLCDCIISCLLLSSIFAHLESRIIAPRALSWTGSHCLVYYFICGGVPLLTAKIMTSIGLPYNDQYWRVALVFIIVYIVATAITWFIYRYLPFMVSVRKRK